MADYSAQARYDAANAVRLCIKLNIKTDADILDWLKAQTSKQGAIKDLIRKEIESK